MEIKIVITKHNKDRILKLLDQLVECEAEAIAAESTERITLGKAGISANHIDSLREVADVTVDEPKIRRSEFGAWGMFNSFVPGKAAIRILANLVRKNGGEPVRFSDLIDDCIKYISRARLGRFRGFPKKTSDSARARLAYHLIMPFHDMGLLRIYDNEKNPHTMVTKDGMDFAMLPNPLLDEEERNGDSLSEKEREWLINHLRKIDEQGYKEFSLLKDFTLFLSSAERQFDDLVDWFRRNQNFVNWLRSGSRYKDDPSAFLRQLQNISRTFASGKVALLRELGVVSSARATYKVLQSLEDRQKSFQKECVRTTIEEPKF